MLLPKAAVLKPHCCLQLCGCLNGSLPVSQAHSAQPGCGPGKSTLKPSWMALLTFMMMLTDLSLGRKMHTLRRSCMTLLLWKVSLFIVLWAGQGAGWVRWVLSNFSGSQHSKANFSSSSYGQQKHRGAPQCRFHSCRKSTGRPENKGERVC